MERDERAERPEREAADMEERAEKLGEHIEETRRDWDTKEQDPSVPGARPDEGEDEDADESADEEGS